MNICFIEGDMSRRGGTERMTATLANALVETNKVWVVSLNKSEENVFFEIDKLIKHIFLSEHSNNGGILKSIFQIRKIINMNKIDIVINVDVGMGFYGVLSNFMSSAKVITWEHSNFYNNWNSRLFPFFRRFARKHSDAMVVLTEKDKANYIKNIKTKKTIRVIPNPIERHAFEYNIDSKIILSAGLLVPIKQYDIAMQVAAKVLLKKKDWKWIICGDGPEKSKLEEIIHRYDLDEQIILLGTVIDMDKIYKNAAIYVMTSKREGLPMVLLEAKSWGVPLVSFDIMTGPSAIISDSVNGYLVEPFDIDEMAKKITALMEDNILRETFSKNSVIGLEKFDFSNIIYQWNDLMRGLINGTAD